MLGPVTSTIFGVGIDQIEIERIRKALKRPGDALISRIGHPEELELAPRKESKIAAQYWASRFAAKEAFAKALGTGIGKTVALRDIGVVKDKSGKPELAYSEKLKSHLRKIGVTGSHVSISHTESSAIAIVILTGELHEDRHKRRNAPN